MELPGRRLPHDALSFVNYQKHYFPNHPPPAYPLLSRHTTLLGHNRGQPRSGHNRGQPRSGHNRGQPRSAHNRGLPRTQVEDEHVSHDPSMKSFGVLKRRKGSNSRFKVKTNENENINVVLGETNRAGTHLNLRPGDLLGRDQKDSWIHTIKEQLLKMQEFGKGRSKRERNCDEVQNETMIGFLEEPWFGHDAGCRKGAENKCSKRNESSTGMRTKMVSKTNIRKSGMLERGHGRRAIPPSYNQHCAIVLKRRRRATRRLQDTLHRMHFTRHAQSHHNQWEKDEERCSEETFWSDPDHLLFGPRSKHGCSRSCSLETHVDRGLTKFGTQCNEMQLQPHLSYQGTEDNGIRTFQSTSDFTVPQYQQQGLNGRLVGRQDQCPTVWAPQQEVAFHGRDTQAAYQRNHFGRGFYNKVKQQSFKDSYSFPVADPCFKNTAYRSLPSWPTDVGYCQGILSKCSASDPHITRQRERAKVQERMRLSKPQMEPQKEHMTIPRWKLPGGSRKTTTPAAKMHKVDIFKAQLPGLEGQSLRSFASTNQPLLPQPHRRSVKDGMHRKGSYSLDHCSEPVWNHKQLLVIIDARGKHVTQYLCPNHQYCAGSTSWTCRKQEQPSRVCMCCKGCCDGVRPCEPQYSEAQSGKPHLQTKMPTPTECDASTSNYLERSRKDPCLSELAERATNILQKPVTEEMVALLARKLLQLASKEAQLDDNEVHQERVLPTNNESCAHDKGVASCLEYGNTSLGDAEQNLRARVLNTTTVNGTHQGGKKRHIDKHSLLGASQPISEGGGALRRDVKTQMKYYTYLGRTMSEINTESNDCSSQHEDDAKQNAFNYCSQGKVNGDGSEVPMCEQGTGHWKDLSDNGSDSSSTSVETVISSAPHAISCLPTTIHQCNPDQNWSLDPVTGDNQEADMLSSLHTWSSPTMSLSGVRVKDESSAEKGCTTDGSTWNFAYAVCLRQTDEGSISTITDCGSLGGEIDEWKGKAEEKQKSRNPEKDENVWRKKVGDLEERNERNNEEVDFKPAVEVLEKPGENEKKKEYGVRVEEREQRYRETSLTMEGTKKGTGRKNEIEIVGKPRTGTGGEAEEGLTEGTMVEQREKIRVKSRKREVQDKKGNRKTKRQSSPRCSSQ